ncbi:MAG: type II toxin-antitoxin system Phd/YefM family antitoxin [Burkholderiaceae bacterium]|nr:MAG: type II toxin-antitoxin system Phd/YefM family antitoxin [Burkholderiaceae bacterium]TAM04284.1 MAG: type II toxin-antitoxin system Phd/YefM family antitoxin [Pusillimonas sp.]
MPGQFEAIPQLPTATASTIKREGWKGVMRALNGVGRLVVTNHNEPEAVILSTQEYDRLIKAARAAANAVNDPLQALRDRFDARLATLDMPDTGNRLRTLMSNPGTLGGKVKAGETY